MATRTGSSVSTASFTDQRSAIGCLIGAWLLSVVTQGYIIVPASVLPIITSEFSVSSSTAVWIVSATPGAWAVTNFLLGAGIDRYGDVTATVAATFTVAGASILSWWAGANGLFWLLLVARVIAGAGIGVIWTASANVVGQVFTHDTRGTALGLFTTSAPAGFALAQIVTPIVARSHAWAATFLIVALCAVAALAVFGVSLRFVQRQPRETSETAIQNFSQVLQSRPVRFGCVLAFAAYSLYLFMNSWMPTYLSQNFSISLGLSGLLASLFPAVGVVSRAGGGYLSDRVLGRRRLPVIKVSFLVALPVVLLIARTSSVRLIALLLVVSGFVIQLTFGVVYTYVQESVDLDVSGTALSLLGTAGVSGAFSAPLVAGVLIDTTETYTSAFAYAAGIAVVGLVLAWFAPES
ncbi:nitrate/nitrite transporter [Natronomonas sp. CBA1123]|uniref:MFS transporter n=1 Tax=Natronomonas sp. CBA1123 TaxID=2668070 RepID=UPI0018D220F2|nr:MFS transporter [Natronomonas sp. CBA1123]